MKKTYTMKLAKNDFADVLTFTATSDFKPFYEGGTPWLNSVAATMNELGIPASDVKPNRLFWKDEESGQCGEVNFAAVGYVADRMDMLAVFE